MNVRRLNDRAGKISLISRQTTDHESPSTTPAVGCPCNEITLTVAEKPVALQVWDTAGQEMYRALVPVYLGEAQGAIVFYDIAEFHSFNSLSH
jgi:GTPase SAR1 family protein